MECKFTVGQKVTPTTDKWCVFLYGPPNSAFTGAPKVGDILEISEIFLEAGHPMLRFTKYVGVDVAVDYRCFRPLQNRPKEADTDVSVFYPLLNIRVVEGVDAL